MKMESLTFFDHSDGETLLKSAKLTPAFVDGEFG